MFENFFGEFIPLAMDPALTTVIYRTMVVLDNRSEYLRKLVKDWIIELRTENLQPMTELAGELEKGTSSEH